MNYIGPKKCIKCSNLIVNFKKLYGVKCSQTPKLGRGFAAPLQTPPPRRHVLHRLTPRGFGPEVARPSHFCEAGYGSDLGTSDLLSRPELLFRGSET